MVEIRTITKKKFISKDPVEVEEMTKKLRKEHDKLVKGMFEFIDAQGGFVEFAYRFFKDEPIQMIKLVHGEICELPMGIVRHINNTVKKVRYYEDKPSEANGSPFNAKSYTKQSRLRFIPVDMI